MRSGPRFVFHISAVGHVNRWRDCEPSGKSMAVRKRPPQPSGLKFLGGNHECHGPHHRAVAVTGKPFKAGATLT